MCVCVCVRERESKSDLRSPSGSCRFEVHLRLMPVTTPISQTVFVLITSASISCTMTTPRVSESFWLPIMLEAVVCLCHFHVVMHVGITYTGVQSFGVSCLLITALKLQILCEL